jgi:hypothetical protein
VTLGCRRCGSRYQRDLGVKTGNETGGVEVLSRLSARCPEVASRHHTMRNRRAPAGGAGEGETLVGYSGVLKWIYDWQTIIAGLAAIFGGWLAYRGGIRQADATRDAAGLQIKALTEQTSAVKQQNAYLVRADQRNHARERLIAARTLVASMVVVAKGIQNAKSRFGYGGREGYVDPQTAEDIRQLIGKPGFNFLWEKVGILDHEIGVPFLELEAAIDQMRKVKGNHTWPT